MEISPWWGQVQVVVGTACSKGLKPRSWSDNPPYRKVFRESCCSGLQHKMGGNVHLKLNICERPIANKYREGKMKSTSSGSESSAWNIKNKWIAFDCLVRVPDLKPVHSVSVHSHLDGTSFWVGEKDFDSSCFRVMGIMCLACSGMRYLHPVLLNSLSVCGEYESNCCHEACDVFALVAG